MHDIQKQLEEIERVHADVQRHMDRFTGLLKTTYANPTPTAMNILRAEHRELNRQNALLETHLNKLKEKSQMKRVSLLAILVIMLLVAVSSFAVAQDEPLATNTVQVIEGTATLVESIPTVVPAPAATEVPPVIVVSPPATSDTSLYWIFSAVIFGLLGVIVLVLRPLIVQLGQSAPQWLVESVFSGGNSALDRAQQFAASTPSHLDDDLVAELRKEIASLKAEIFKPVTTMAAPGPNREPSDLLSGAWNTQYPIDEPPQG